MKGAVFMLAWIPVLIITGFIGGCAVVITTSSYQLIKSISRIQGPGKRESTPRAIQV